MPKHRPEAARAECFCPCHQTLEEYPLALPLAARKVPNLASKSRRIREARATRKPFPDAGRPKANRDKTHRHLGAFRDGVAEGGHETAAAAARAGLRVIGKLPLIRMKRGHQSRPGLLPLVAMIRGIGLSRDNEHLPHPYMPYDAHHPEGAFPLNANFQAMPAAGWSAHFGVNLGRVRLDSDQRPPIRHGTCAHQSCFERPRFLAAVGQRSGHRDSSLSSSDSLGNLIVQREAQSQCCRSLRFSRSETGRGQEQRSSQSHEVAGSLARVIHGRQLTAFGQREARFPGWGTPVLPWRREDTHSHARRQIVAWERSASRTVLPGEC